MKVSSKTRNPNDTIISKPLNRSSNDIFSNRTTAVTKTHHRATAGTNTSSGTKIDLFSSNRAQVKQPATKTNSIGTNQTSKNSRTFPIFELSPEVAKSKAIEMSDNIEHDYLYPNAEQVRDSEEEISLTPEQQKRYTRCLDAMGILIQISKCDKSNAHYFGYKNDNNELIGLLVMENNTIEYVVTIPGSAVGNTLIEFAVQQSKEQNYGGVVQLIAFINANSFYDRLGFEVKGITKEGLDRRMLDPKKHPEIWQKTNSGEFTLK